MTLLLPHPLLPLLPDDDGVKGLINPTYMVIRELTEGRLLGPAAARANYVLQFQSPQVGPLLLLQQSKKLIWDSAQTHLT